MNILLWFANSPVGRAIAAGFAAFLALLAFRQKYRHDGAVAERAKTNKATTDAIISHAKVKKEIGYETDDELLGRITRKSDSVRKTKPTTR
jgi:hypothetical protein